MMNTQGGSELNVAVRLSAKLQQRSNTHQVDDTGLGLERIHSQNRRTDKDYIA